MSKKSVRSQGYRKPEKETKKGYSPKEKKTMIIGFAVLAVIIIAALVLPEIIESFSLLKVKDGVVQGVEDNWLICDINVHNRKSSQHKYRKLAEVETPAGYESVPADEALVSTDPNVKNFEYKGAEDGLVDQLYIQPGAKDADELVEKYREVLPRMTDVLYMGDVVKGELNGMDTYSFLVEYRMEDYSAAAEKAEAEAEAAAEAAEEPAATEAPAEEPAATEAPAEEPAATEAPAEEPAATEAPAEEAADAEAPAEEVVYDYTQNVVLYIDSGVNGYCVVVNGMNTGSDESVFVDRDAMMEEILKAASVITVEK